MCTFDSIYENLHQHNHTTIRKICWLRLLRYSSSNGYTYGFSLSHCMCQKCFCVTKHHLKIHKTLFFLAFVNALFTITKFETSVNSSGEKIYVLAYLITLNVSEIFGKKSAVIYIYIPRSTTLLYINVLTYNILSYIYSKLETLPALNADACLPTSIVTNTTITPTTSTTTTSFNATDSMVFSPMSSIQEQEQVS